MAMTKRVGASAGAELTWSNKLEALIKQAMDNSWFDEPLSSSKWEIDVENKAVTVHAPDRDWYLSVTDLIFNHDFARALFGECTDWHEPLIGEYRVPQNGMEHHLQQAVISKDPIDYMYNVVFKKKAVDTPDMHW